MEPGRLLVPEPGAEWARAVGCGVWQAGSHCEQRRPGVMGAKAVLAPPLHPPDSVPSSTEATNEKSAQGYYP